MTTVASPANASGRVWKRYPKYRDSGIEWLGEMPAHWRVQRLKDCVAALLAGGTPDTGDEANWTDSGDGIPWVSISDMTRGSLVLTTEKRITEVALERKPLPILPSGTLLYSMYASVGKVAVLGLPAATNQAILGILPGPELGRAQLRRWLEHLEQHVRAFASSNTQDNLNEFKVRNMPVFQPPDEEQLGIAGFLDRETARIDALIEHKERLIGLLREQRSSLITDLIFAEAAVDVQLKRSLRSIEQGWSPACENRPAEADEWGVLKVGCVNRAQFDPSENKALPSELDPVPDLDFPPASGLNPELRRLYEANLFTVIRQLRYSEKTGDSLDIGLFLNGIPIFTAELKNQPTGQNV